MLFARLIPIEAIGVKYTQLTKNDKAMIKRISKIVIKALGVVVATAALAIVATSISPIYNFGEPQPFSGPNIFNPYRDLDTTYCWKRANLHTHTRVEGPLNECEKWPREVYDEYQKYGYDIVTFSNHNEITKHPVSKELQVNLYEHGYNLLKFHKLVFGSNAVMRFDHLIPAFAFQRQWQLDLLGKESDIIVLNHPLRTPLTTQAMLEKLEGYHIVELDSGKSTENEYWDWALSAGHYSFGVANDDLHHPERTEAIAVRSNFMCCPSATYADIKESLLGGCYYSMRIPDYGEGDVEVKIAKNRDLPRITNIGVKGDTIYMSLSHEAAEIKVIGQNHTLLQSTKHTSEVHYVLGKDEPYARFIIYFEDGAAIYTNPFARYDSSLADTPFHEPTHSVNIALTILYNLLLAFIAGGLLYAIYRIIKRK